MANDVPVVKQRVVGVGVAFPIASLPQIHIIFKVHWTVGFFLPDFHKQRSWDCPSQTSIRGTREGSPEHSVLTPISVLTIFIPAPGLDMATILPLFLGGESLCHLDLAIIVVGLLLVFLDMTLGLSVLVLPLVSVGLMADRGCCDRTSQLP